MHGLGRRWTASLIKASDKAGQDTLADSRGTAKLACWEGRPFTLCSSILDKTHGYFYSIQALLP